MASKHLIKELKTLKIFGISVLGIFDIYVDSTFHNFLMTFVMYILDVFIA